MTNISSIFSDQIYKEAGIVVISKPALYEAMRIGMYYLFDKGHDDTMDHTISENLPSQFLDKVWKNYDEVPSTFVIELVEQSAPALAEFAYNYGRKFIY